MTDELLTLDDIASMYRCGRRHARDVITKLIGFPVLARPHPPIQEGRCAYLGKDQQTQRPITTEQRLLSGHGRRDCAEDLMVVNSVHTLVSQ